MTTKKIKHYTTIELTEEERHVLASARQIVAAIKDSINEANMEGVLLGENSDWVGLTYYVQEEVKTCMDLLDSLATLKNIALS